MKYTVRIQVYGYNALGEWTLRNKLIYPALTEDEYEDWYSRVLDAYGEFHDVEETALGWNGFTQLGDVEDKTYMEVWVEVQCVNGKKS